jgi:hypothetical protein
MGKPLFVGSALVQKSKILTNVRATLLGGRDAAPSAFSLERKFAHATTVPVKNCLGPLRTKRNQTEHVTG